MRWMIRTAVLVLAAVAVLPAPAVAQSPNTATIVVLVADQSGGAVQDARVTVTNSETGAVREAVSGERRCRDGGGAAR